MTATPSPGPDVRDADRLGGRLELLDPASLDADQARLREELLATRGPDAEAAGFQLVLPDGRLIGPFNAWLRAPAIGQAIRGWAAAANRYDLPEDVQQVTILTVGAAWRSPYEIYAHRAEARHAGVSDAAIEAILADQPPADLSGPAETAHRFTRALVVDHEVSDELYAEAVGAFGQAGLFALVNVIGRYLNTSAILACFRVPAP
jgi:4-carboxymuconolactone decarboxylase